MDGVLNGCYGIYTNDAKMNSYGNHIHMEIRETSKKMGSQSMKNQIEHLYLMNLNHKSEEKSKKFEFHYSFHYSNKAVFNGGPGTTKKESMDYILSGSHGIYTNDVN